MQHDSKGQGYRDPSGWRQTRSVVSKLLREMVVKAGKLITGSVQPDILIFQVQGEGELERSRKERAFVMGKGWGNAVTSH